MPPARHVAVLTCMDARLHPERFLGLDIGDAHVIRNAGGRASANALRSLIISSKLLGTREFVVIHHTDCGMLTFTSQELQGRLTEETGADASDIDFLTFADLEESVLEDVRRIKESPFIADDIPVSGFVYDVQSGRLKEVVGPTAGPAAWVAGGSSEHRRGRMPRLTGTIAAGSAPADGAYVQIQNLAGDFQGDVRTDAAGGFVLHLVPGRWRLVSCLPGDGRAELEVEVGTIPLEVEMTLA